MTSSLPWNFPPIPPGGAVYTELDVPDVFHNNLLVDAMNSNTVGAATLLSPVVPQPGNVRAVIANCSANVVNLN